MCSNVDSRERIGGGGSVVAGGLSWRTKIQKKTVHPLRKIKIKQHQMNEKRAAEGVNKSPCVC
jgi:hypothetical protein